MKNDSSNFSLCPAHTSLNFHGQMDLWRNSLQSDRSKSSNDNLKKIKSVVINSLILKGTSVYMSTLTLTAIAIDRSVHLNKLMFLILEKKSLYSLSTNKSGKNVQVEVKGQIRN